MPNAVRNAATISSIGALFVSKTTRSCVPERRTSATPRPLPWHSRVKIVTSVDRNFFRCVLHQRCALSWLCIEKDTPSSAITTLGPPVNLLAGTSPPKHFRVPPEAIRQCNGDSPQKGFDLGDPAAIEA